MTSLFRRRNINGSARGSTTTQELNNSRPVRRLEFNQAMEDFKIMFPNMEYDIIECVLRANSGAVDATIDQLLQMSVDNGRYDDSSDSDDNSIPPEILERNLEPDSSDEEPPPVYSPPSHDMHLFDRPYPHTSLTSPPRTVVNLSSGSKVPTMGRNWNPPLLGNLPDDFLRILPQQMDSVQSCQIGPSTLQCEDSKKEPISMDQERKLKQYLQDERIALFLQNEEFMRELQRNREFLHALERDRLKYESKKSSTGLVNNDFSFYPSISVDEFQAVSVGCDSTTTISDDALFRDKLKHMGKSTRKKLFEIARAFSEKTKMRKSKRKHLLKHQVLGTATSTANLLDDVEGHSCDEDVQARMKQLNCEVVETQKGQ